MFYEQKSKFQSIVAGGFDSLSLAADVGCSSLVCSNLKFLFSWGTISKGQVSKYKKTGGINLEPRM